MSMQAATLHILQAAHFTQPQALALAEAIETEIKGTELVTVPVLDSRFGALEARFAAIDLRFAELHRDMAKLEARLTGKMMALGISVTAIIVSTMFYLLRR